MNTPELHFAADEYPKSQCESALQKIKKPVIHFGTGNPWHGEKSNRKMEQLMSQEGYTARTKEKATQLFTYFFVSFSVS